MKNKKQRKWEYLEHDTPEGFIREGLPFTTLLLEVVLELPDDPSYGLLPLLHQGGLVLLEEGVQVNVLLEL